MAFLQRPSRDAVRAGMFIGGLMVLSVLVATFLYGSRPGVAFRPDGEFVLRIPLVFTTVCAVTVCLWTLVVERLRRGSALLRGAITGAAAGWFAGELTAGILAAETTTLARLVYTLGFGTVGFLAAVLLWGPAVLPITTVAGLWFGSDPNGDTADE